VLNSLDVRAWRKHIFSGGEECTFSGRRGLGPMGLSTEEEYVEHARHADEVGESGSEEVYDEYGRDSDEYSDEFREVAYRGGADYAHDDDEDEDGEGMLMARSGSVTDDEEGNDDDGEDFASGACDEDVCLPANPLDHRPARFLPAIWPEPASTPAVL
jgi:hypothetical protein